MPPRSRLLARRVGLEAEASLRALPPPAVGPTPLLNYRASSSSPMAPEALAQEGPLDLVEVVAREATPEEAGSPQVAPAPRGEAAAVAVAPEAPRLTHLRLDPLPRLYCLPKGGRLFWSLARIAP